MQKAVFTDNCHRCSILSFMRLINSRHKRWWWCFVRNQINCAGLLNLARKFALCTNLNSKLQSGLNLSGVHQLVHCAWCTIPTSTNCKLLLVAVLLVHYESQNPKNPEEIQKNAERNPRILVCTWRKFQPAPIANYGRRQNTRALWVSKTGKYLDSCCMNWSLFLIICQIFICNCQTKTSYKIRSI